MLRRISLVVVAFCMLALPASSLAQATRTWISGVGDDANPCSRTAPCKTLAGAYSKTEVGGEIDALDPGGFGSLTVTHSITIDGGGGQVASVLVAGTDGIRIQAGAGDHVILRNLRINGSPTAASPAGLSGINFTSGGSLQVENLSIFGFGQNGISDTAPGSSLVASNTTVENSGGDGVMVAPPAGSSAQALLENDGLENNQCGVAVGAFGATGSFATHCGLADSGSAASGVTVSLNGGSTSSNVGTGVLTDGAPSTAFLSSALVFGNAIGLQPVNGGSIVSWGVNNSVYGNGSNGSPTSTVLTVPQPAQGQPGAPGQPGHVVLVTCKTIRRTVKLRRHHKVHRKIVTSRRCTARPVTGTVTFTAS